MRYKVAYFAAVGLAVLSVILLIKRYGDIAVVAMKFSMTILTDLLLK